MHACTYRYIHMHAWTSTLQIRHIAHTYIHIHNLNIHNLIDIILESMCPRSRGSSKRSWLRPQGAVSAALSQCRSLGPVTVRRIGSQMCYGQPPLPPHVLSAPKQHHTLEVECLNRTDPHDHLRLRYAMAKKVNFVIENPSSTLLWRYLPLRELWPIM